MTKCIGCRLDQCTRAIDDDATAQGVSRPERQRARIDGQTPVDGLSGTEGQCAAIDDDATREIIAHVRKRGRTRAVLNDARCSDDALGAAKRISQRGVINRHARRRNVGFANDDGAARSEVIEDDGIAQLEIGGRIARHNPEVVYDATSCVPGCVRCTSDITSPADGNARYVQGKLAGICRNENPRLTTVKARDGTKAKGSKVGEGSREVDQVVAAIRKRTGVGRRDEHRARPTIGGQGTDIQQRGRSTEIEITEAERRSISQDGAQHEVADGEATRGTVTRLDLATRGHINRPEEGARAPQGTGITHISSDVRTGVTTEGKDPAVDIHRHGAGQGTGRTEIKGTRPSLDELGRTRAVDGAAKGDIRTDSEFAIGTEKHRPARGARAFEGGDGLDGAVEVKLHARRIRKTNGRISREVSVRTSPEGTAIESGLKRVDLRRRQGPCARPTLGEGGRVAKVRRQRAIASARQHQGTVHPIQALGIQRPGSTIHRQHPCVGAEGERAAIRWADRHRPGIITRNILQDRRDGRRARVRNPTR